MDVPIFYRNDSNELVFDCSSMATFPIYRGIDASLQYVSKVLLTRRGTVPDRPDFGGDVYRVASVRPGNTAAAAAMASMSIMQTDDTITRYQPLDLIETEKISSIRLRSIKWINDRWVMSITIILVDGNTFTSYFNAQ